MSESFHAAKQVRVRPDRTGIRCAALAALVAIACCSTASAIGYGDMEVAIETAPAADAAHGYAEMWVRVTNRSKDKAREVRLTYPKRSYSSGEDHIRAVSRTITVDPGKTARASLAFPIRPPTSGSGLGVTIDGREQNEPVPLDVALGSSSSRYRHSSMGSGTRSIQPTVLYSRSVDTRFPDWAQAARRALTSRAPGGAEPPKRPPMGKGFEEDDPDDPAPAAVTRTFESGAASFIRADLPAANWSPNWLGYSRFDGVVLTSDDLRSMPDEVRSALGQYVECGGSLLVLGRDPPLPGKWKLEKWPDQRGADGEAGFGACFCIERTDLSDKPSSYLQKVVPSWSRTLRPWTTTRTAAQANLALPIVDDVSFPASGLLAVMVCFVIVAGPLTLYFLARWGRRLWLFWVVPLISAFTCLTVFGYVALNEGWSGRSRIVGITILDENTHRASSMGWSAFYTPLSAGGGLHFSANTEVTFQNGDESDYYSYRRRNSSGSPMTIEWTGEQHLASGWLSPRVPAHFLIRKSEVRRERVGFSRGADGRPEAVNGLGADLEHLWYADESGKIFHAQNVAAGAKCSLEPAAGKSGRRSALKSFSDIYASEWLTTVSELAKDGPPFLKPRTYLAVLASAPFFDAALPDAKSRQAQSIVIGLIREGGDED
jgi:hypothetical protein